MRLFSRLGITSVGDLLQFYPRDYEDRSRIVSLVEAAQVHAAAVLVTVVRHDYFPFAGGRTLKIIVADDSSDGALVCFGRNFLSRSFEPGKRFFIWGQFRFRKGEIQASSFDAEPEEKASSFGSIQPVYQLTEGLGQTTIRRAVATALQQYGKSISDELPEMLRREKTLLEKRRALRAIHLPSSMKELEKARKRLVFEELFLFQLELTRLALLRRRQARRERTHRLHSFLEPFLEGLPFTLTVDQAAVREEIAADMERPEQMIRLLQGDVGSGKTLVALLAALDALERGYQVAFMAPTELLARQHALTVSRLLDGFPVRIALALGTMSTAQRKLLYRSVEEGETHLIVGTHALFSADVTYRNLGLVVVDEQHRFGVEQRAKLSEKGLNPDILLMSATPIPRSLALTAFGDTDISTIRTMPPGRVPIETHLTKHGSEENVFQAVDREIEAGHQAYFVYPRISAEGVQQLKNVEEMYGFLHRRFAGRRLALVHGRIDEETREERMNAFRDGTVDILVATTVVEVGVDVPNATCMVIEHAEIFGLAALHQLRGRVGRGSEQSYCFLIYDPDLTETARDRLRIMYEERDGFVIAEEDLRLRGPGDLSGLKQSGFLRFRLADIQRDMKVMQESRQDARTLLEEDPDLTKPEHGALKEILSCR